MEVLVNVTASISLPPSLLSDLQGGEEVRRDDAVQRLSYSVFLTDALFQSPNQTARNLSIGTIIVALRLRSVTENQTLTMPINTTFRINEVSWIGEGYIISTILLVLPIIFFIKPCSLFMYTRKCKVPSQAAVYTGKLQV